MKKIPAKAIIVFTILYLENFLRFINPNVLFYIPLGAGVSLNLKDMLIIGFIVYFFFSVNKKYVSLHLRLLIVFLGVSLLSTVFISIFAYDATLGVIGDRLRYYFNYALIIGLVMLVKGNKNFNFLICLIFSIGLIACCIHFIEYVLGSPLYVSGGGVTSKFFTEGGGAGEFMGIKRIWNRASGITMLMFVFSATFLASNMKGKLFYVFSLFSSLASIALSLTRTIYIFVACTFLAILLTSLFHKENKPAFFCLIVLIVSAAGIAYTTTKNPEMIEAMTGRFQTIVELYTRKKPIETMSARQQQYEFLKKKMKEADIPPVLGIGITNKTAQYRTSDLGFMNMIVNMGLAAVLFIIFMFIYLYAKSAVLMKRATLSLHRSIGMSIFCMLPGLFLIGYNFDYLTGTHFVLLALPIVLLEAGICAIRQHTDQDLIKDEL